MMARVWDCCCLHLTRLQPSDKSEQDPSNGFWQCKQGTFSCCCAHVAYGYTYTVTYKSISIVAVYSLQLLGQLIETQIL